MIAGKSSFSCTLCSHFRNSLHTSRLANYFPGNSAFVLPKGLVSSDCLVSQVFLTRISEIACILVGWPTILQETLHSYFHIHILSLEQSEALKLTKYIKRTQLLWRLALKGCTCTCSKNSNKKPFDSRTQQNSNRKVRSVLRAAHAAQHTIHCHSRSSMLTVGGRPISEGGASNGSIAVMCRVQPEKDNSSPTCWGTELPKSPEKKQQ